jgi:hypothetical protein
VWFRRPPGDERDLTAVGTIACALASLLKLARAGINTNWTGAAAVAGAGGRRR